MATSIQTNKPKLDAWLVIDRQQSYNLLLGYFTILSQFRLKYIKINMEFLTQKLKMIAYSASIFAPLIGHLWHTQAFAIK